MAAGVLTAATAVPALALENEFHGLIRAQYQLSDFNGSKTGQWFFEPTGLDQKAPTANTFDQRARLFYTAKVNENVKLVTGFELDYASIAWILSTASTITRCISWAVTSTPLPLTTPLSTATTTRTRG